MVSRGSDRGRQDQVPGHRPRKRFGQNFLHDQGVIARILRAVDARPGEHLVEIGPGRGAITQGLIQACGRLDVIELDRDLIEPLRERLQPLGDLHVHQADALKFDFTALAAPGTRLRLVGNLPYNISTPLLFHFLDQAEAIEDMHLMLQKEVVDRICAVPGSKVYGRLSVMVQTHCDAERLFVIGPGAFTPAPKVDSAVIRLVPHRPARHALIDPQWHQGLVAAAFAQRRKTLQNALRGLLHAEQISACDIDPRTRAEQLSIADYIRLANFAAQTSSHE